MKDLAEACAALKGKTPQEAETLMKEWGWEREPDNLSRNSTMWVWMTRIPKSPLCLLAFKNGRVSETLYFKPNE